MFNRRDFVLAAGAAAGAAAAAPAASTKSRHWSVINSLTGLVCRGLFALFRSRERCDWSNFAGGSRPRRDPRRPRISAIRAADQFGGGDAGKKF